MENDVSQTYPAPAPMPVPDNQTPLRSSPWFVIIVAMLLLLVAAGLLFIVAMQFTIIEQNDFSVTATPILQATIPPPVP